MGERLSYLTTDEQREIYRYFEGYGLQETQARYQVSRTRIYQIKKLIQNQDEIRAQMGSLSGLSIRTYNALLRAGIKNTKTLKAFITAEGPEKLKKFRNIGDGNVKEIVDFIKSQTAKEETECT